MKKIKNKKLLIIKLIFIILIIYSSVKIFNWYNNNRKNEKILISTKKNVKETKEGYEVDFKKLKEENPNTIAWIKVNGTDIDYPVVKGEDNSYYLTHSFDKSYNTAGWIFANYQNKFDGSDKNITIFGHAMRNGSMFGTMKNILTEEWQKNKDNLIITLITEKETSKYEVFSTYKVEDEAYYFTNSFSGNDFQKFIEKIKSRSTYDYNVSINENDKILTLSTCDTSNSDYRVVLHAKK